MGTGNQSEPIILISSHDHAPSPRVAGAVKLAALAHAHGWVTDVTYALADVPDEYYLNGNLAHPAHRLASVVVRLLRPRAVGWASWHREDDGAFGFVHAFVNCERFGWKVGAKLPSILERITKP